MGFLSASASFTRYRIVEDVPESLWPRIPDLLLQNAFQDIDNTHDERAYGWVSIDSMLDTEWSIAPAYKGEFVAFALRLDTRRIPPSVMKKHYQIALEELSRKNKEDGKSYVSRSQKQELREQVRLRLLGRTLPVPAVFDVVWNTSNNRVFFASTQQKMLPLFEELFTQTFQLHLEPLTPYFLALNLLPEDRKAEVNEYEPAIFVE
jgi:DNA recombination-dependent growth factor C